MYAALVAPDGTTTALTGPNPPTGAGEIYSVAISESGVALIGGQDSGAPYLGLVAPGGNTTALTGDLPMTTGTIFSVAFPLPEGSGGNGGNGSSTFNIDPGSVGSGNTFATPILAISTNALRNHLSILPDRSFMVSDVDTEAISYLAGASNTILTIPSCSKNSKYAIWLAPIGVYARLKEENAFPKLKDKSIGGILGFDYTGWEKAALGFGVAYAYQDVKYSDNLNKAKIHQELATLYGAYYGDNFVVQGAIFGGIYQEKDHRSTLGFISSKASINGGLLSPHLNIQRIFGINDRMNLIPFIQADWVNNWQGSIRERGRAGLNLRIGSQYVSLLRAEAGMRFNQKMCLKNGMFKLEEGLSYVNKTPFNVKDVSAYYVGSISTFSVQIFSNESHHLGALYIGASYTPNKTLVPCLAVNYQGEWGNKEYSHILSLDINQRF